MLYNIIVSDNEHIDNEGTKAMKLTIRISAAITGAALMLSLAAACGEQAETQTPASTTASAEIIETAPAETEPQRELPDLPGDKDYGGYEFNVIDKGAFNTHWTSRDVFAAEQTGDPINDAVYERNSKVEEKYNVKITEDAGQSDPAGAAKKVALAGDDTYDFYAFSMQSYASLATQGLLLDWNKIPYIDLDRVWYDQNCRESLSIGGKVYFASGDFNIMDKDATWAIMFNKNLARNLNLPDLYAMVNDGTWTMEALYSCMANASADINGDGQHGYDDQWGMAGENWNTNALVAAAGVKVFDKDENDMPFVAMNTERYFQAFEIASQIMGDRDKTMSSSWVTGFADVWEDCFHAAFKEDRLLFYFTGLNRCTLLRSMETDFGIVPNPKYTESQERYYDLISLASGNGMAIPVTTQDTERTGIIVEALSAESKYTLTPAYYDITLKTKLSRDEESAAMLDIIFTSRVFELGLEFGWGGLFDLPGSLTGKGSDAIASSVAKKIPSAEKAMQKDLDKLAALEG